MSFRDAEASDQALNGIATDLRAALEQPGYQRNPNQVYDNMDSDPLIGALPEDGKPMSRTGLLRRVNDHRADPTAIPDQVVLFCRANLQQGPLFAAAGTSVFGRVQGLRSLVDTIAGPTSVLSRRDAEAFVRDLVAMVADSATKLARQKSELAGKKLSRYQMWCYPASDPGDPFREIGTTRADAVNVLGLGFYAFETPDAKLVR